MKKPSYEELEKENAQLRLKVAELAAALADVKALLERFTKQDSHNSHKPPSQDKKRYPKTKLKASLVSKKRVRSKETLDFKDEIDYEVFVPLETEACGCGQSLKPLASSWERVQVHDLPALKLEITEYRRERKRCGCGRLFEASLPTGVTRGVQYGGRVKGLLTYLHHYQLIPLQRCTELLRDCFGETMCEQSLLRAEQSLFERLEAAEQKIIEALRCADAVHADETGLFVNRKRQWLHVRSNEQFTYYHLDASRGLSAHKQIGILDTCQGCMVHDCFHSYFHHAGSHVLCHAHTVRELTAVWEETAQAWALELAQHLLDAHAERQGNLSKVRQAELIATYHTLLNQGLKLNPEVPRPEGKLKRGRVKQSKAHNLVKRLLEHTDAALRFIRDASVPFSNNQAERDLRMAKLKQKISGGFRTEHGARIFCRIRGYISTLRKQGVNILESLNAAFESSVVTPWASIG